MPAKTHAVVVIALNERQEILLQREYSYPSDKALWQLPGGGMLEDENVVTVANRELSEAAGLVEVIGSFT